MGKQLERSRVVIRRARSAEQPAEDAGFGHKKILQGTRAGIESPVAACRHTRRHFTQSVYLCCCLVQPWGLTRNPRYGAAPSQAAPATGARRRARAQPCGTTRVPLTQRARLHRTLGAAHGSLVTITLPRSLFHWLQVFPLHITQQNQQLHSIRLSNSYGTGTDSGNSASEL